MKIRIARLITPLLFTPLIAFAEEAPKCYQITMNDTPVNSLSIGHTRVERWCYQKLSSPAGSLYIYNADQDRVRPELAMVVEPDGIITHGSLLAGDVTTHKVKSSQFVPFSVPLQEPVLAAKSANVEMTAEMVQSSYQVLDQLFRNRSDVVDLDVVPGETSGTATATILPWRGYWWPYKGLPLSTPLRKYDAYVKGKTGVNPGAASWEATYHVSHGIWWEGHCNGWAASAVLRRQPTHSKIDSRTGTVFSVVDQKGILAETDYCANVAFFGRRYNGSGDITDIYPATFHKALTYYVGTLQKPVVIDYHRDPAVDNHVVSGYKMDIQNTGDNEVTVTAKLTFHKYDGYRTNTPGTAPIYYRTYKYKLYKDAEGNYSSGKWISTNPDFLWVPLSIADCSANNSRISHARVQEILDLPAAN